MSGIVACVAATLLGIDIGWQPRPDGGMEYIIQIEPETLQSLQPGELIQSSPPLGLRDFRTVRILVGNKKLPRNLPEETPGLAASAAETPPKVPGRASGGRSPLMSGFWGPGATLSGDTMPKGETPAAPPSALPPMPGSKPLAERQALFLEPAGETPKSEEKPLASPTPPSSAAEKAWFWAALLGFFASLSGNVYLGWIYLDVRTRYQATLGRQG